MKILVLCYEYPPVGGGGGRVAAQIAAALVRRGHEVRVMTAGLKHLPKREIIEGVEVLRPESFRQREDTCTVPEMGLYLATGMLPVWGQIRAWRPDVAHAHFAVPTGVLARVMKLLTGTPYVLTAHLGDVPGGVPEQTDHLFKIVDPFVKPVWRAAAAVTAVSRFVAGLAEKAYGVKTTVVPNGLAPIPKPADKCRTSLRIVMAGRLSVQKNPLLAIRAMALIREKNWHCDIVGEGPLGGEMRNLVASENLRDRVTFHGWLPSSQVAAIMDAADVLLMTSLHEGLPMVGVEALQHGLAIVGSNIGGMLDVVDEGKNGFLCALTAESFADKLGLLANDPELLGQLQRASLEKAKTFDLERIVDHYEEILQKAAKIPH